MLQVFLPYSLNTDKENVKGVCKNDSPPKEKIQIFRIVFEEGKPTSLNPYHSSGECGAVFYANFSLKD